MSFLEGNIFPAKNRGESFPKSREPTGGTPLRRSQSSDGWRNCNATKTARSNEAQSWRRPSGWKHFLGGKRSVFVGGLVVFEIYNVYDCMIFKDIPNDVNQ